MQIDFEEIQSKCLNIFNVGAKAPDFFRDFPGKMRHAAAFFLWNPEIPRSLCGAKPSHHTPQTFKHI